MTGTNLPGCLLLTNQPSKPISKPDVNPDDIDFFELHDAFSIMAALSLEACGFAERGQGPRLALDGEIFPKGRIPVTTMGGLKARGHPVGATGIYQIVETVLQLRCEAGPNQVDGARIGMTQNIGGSGSSIITHILKSSIEINQNICTQELRSSAIFS
jgi:acetyl-CoA C-acetyltransferase